jgi:hypothetical protein
LTTFTSYPACCNGSEAYDLKAPKTEGADYSGCKYQGDVAAIGHNACNWVKNNTIVAFYDDHDKSGKNCNTQ